MLNYHNIHRKFLPAVLTGPDGKTKYSWRVAILPQLGFAKLYDQYRRDEPWDSPNNRKVLAKMPPSFRHPSDEQDSTFTSYFALTGEATAFGGGDEGLRTREFADGLANTILIVEAKKAVDWTKPVDIKYSKDDNIPKLGGFHPTGYNAAFADGSVRFLSESTDVTLLRALITRNGHEPVKPSTSDR